MSFKLIEWMAAVPSKGPSAGDVHDKFLVFAPVPVPALC